MTPSLIVLTELLNLQKSGQFPDEPVRRIDEECEFFAQNSCLL
jgi:hypothetical protein